jgi:hypothetical protein
MVSAEEERPDCYKCRWRDAIPGDAHSRCRHPLVNSNADMVDILIGVIEGQYREAARKLGITGHMTGIKNGWFLWPADFDPVWLLACQGFEPRK